MKVYYLAYRFHETETLDNLDKYNPIGGLVMNIGAPDCACAILESRHAATLNEKLAVREVHHKMEQLQACYFHDLWEVETAVFVEWMESEPYSGAEA